MAQFDPGSFRDPDGRVFSHNGDILRTLSGPAQDRLKRLEAAGILDEFVEAGALVPFRLVRAEDRGLDSEQFGSVVGQHDRIPVVTYPYEWSFGMLREAALVTLELVERCLHHGLILKDGTAFNLALMNGGMRFMDITSIDDYVTGQPWDGYGQFCKEFLFPLMLTAYKEMDFQPWFRGTLVGINAVEMARLVGWRDYFRPGVMKHLLLQARMERGFARHDMPVREMFEDAQLSPEFIRNNLRGLRHVIERMSYQPSTSHWLEYADDNTYSETEEQKKKDTVARWVSNTQPRSLVDLGTNIGRYALIAAEVADTVICADSDPACIDTLFCSIPNSPVGRKLVPIVLDLTNPSPGQGWHLSERSSALDRIRSDCFLALALVHHICIGRNIPIEAFVKLLVSLGQTGIIEWVDKTDPMVERLLRNRTDVFSDYTREAFEHCLSRHFRILEQQSLRGGSRHLFLVSAKDPTAAAN